MTDAGRPARIEPEDLLAHVDWARGLAAHLVRDASEADDLVQDALAAAIRRPPSAARPLRPWLAAVLRNLALARRRGDGRRSRRESVVAAEAARAAVPSAADVASRLDAYRILAEVVAELPEPLRSAVYLRYHEGLDSNEIGRRLEVPAGTFRWRLARGLDELRARLDARSKGGRSEWIAALAPIALPAMPHAAPVPAPVSATATGLVTGAIAMALTTKLMLGGAVVLGLAALLATMRDADPLPAGGPSAATDVTSAEALRLEPRDPQPRSPRPRGADEVETAEPENGRATENEEAGAAQAPSRVEVRAQVLDSLGSPATGARVTCGWGGPSAGRDADSDGRVVFTFSSGDDSPRLEFIVSAVRCATRIVPVPAARTAGVIDLGQVRLSAGGTVSGRILEGEAPLAGASVGVLSGGSVIVDVAPAATSDADGRFLLHGVAAGTQLLSIGKEGFRTVTPVAEVRAGEESTAGVVYLERIDPAVRVRGVVLTPHGAPAPRAVVSYRFDGQGSTGMGTTSADERGEFAIEGGREKDWQLTARDATGVWSSAATVRVRSGADDVRLHLSEAKWAEVAVTDAAGAPVETFAAELRGTGQIFLDRFPEGRHAGGLLRIKLPADPFTLVVNAPGHASAVVEAIDPPKLEGRIAVRVSALPGLTGRVTAGGEPVAGALVTLRDVVRPGSRRVQNGFPCRTYLSHEDSATTEADGSFRLTLRSAGHFILRAEKTGFAASEAGPFDLAPETGRSAIELVLTAGGAIEGRVLVAPGRAPDGIIVAASRGDGEARTLRVGPDGAFRFERLTPGRWLVRRVEGEIRPGVSTVLASAGEARFEWSCSVDDGAVTHFDLDLATEPKSVVRGELSVDGSAAAGWRVALLAGTGLLTAEQMASGAVTETGTFRLVAPGPGDYLVRAVSPLGMYVLAPIALGDSEAACSLRIVTGRVEVRGAAASEPSWLLGEDAAGRFAIAEAEVDAQGACAPKPFLAGRVRLVRPTADEPDPRRWPVLAEGELVSGASLTLDVPAK